jgi:hypothetical protein
MHKAIRGVVNFYNAGVVPHDRRIGSRLGEIQVRIHVILVAETNFLPKIG